MINNIDTNVSGIRVKWSAFVDSYNKDIIQHRVHFDISDVGVEYVDTDPTDDRIPSICYPLDYIYTDKQGVTWLCGDTDHAYDPEHQPSLADVHRDTEIIVRVLNAIKTIDKYRNE